MQIVAENINDLIMWSLIKRNSGSSKVESLLMRHTILPVACHNALKNICKFYLTIYDLQYIQRKCTCQSLYHLPSHYIQMVSQTKFRYIMERWWYANWAIQILQSTTKTSSLLNFMNVHIWINEITDLRKLYIFYRRNVKSFVYILKICY